MFCSSAPWSDFPLAAVSSTIRFYTLPWPAAAGQQLLRSTGDVPPVRWFDPAGLLLFVLLQALNILPSGQRRCVPRLIPCGSCLLTFHPWIPWREPTLLCRSTFYPLMQSRHPMDTSLGSCRNLPLHAGSVFCLAWLRCWWARIWRFRPRCQALFPFTCCWRSASRVAWSCSQCGLGFPRWWSRFFLGGDGDVVLVPIYCFFVLQARARTAF